MDERDLWRIEAGLQFAKDFRLEYGPVNELLKLKEGLERGQKRAYQWKRTQKWLENLVGRVGVEPTAR